MNGNKLISGILLSIILIACIKVSSQTNTIIEEAVQLTNVGYSIFSETMVDMPWTEIEQTISDGAIVLLPVGGIEEHGPHMCCGSDTYQACLSAKIIKIELNRKDIPALIAPPFYWGIADIANGFPGTFTVSESTMKSLLYDIFKSLKKWGVKNVIVVNGHGEPKHTETLTNAIAEFSAEIEINIYFLIDDEKLAKFQNSIYKYCVIPVSYQPEIEIECRFDNSHADCIETGTMAGFYPELVDTLMARNLVPTNFMENSEFKSPADVQKAWEADARRITPLGYFGDPASFNAIKSATNYLNNSKSEAEAIEVFFK